MMAEQHPERIGLHNEVHARPHEPMHAPCTVLHWVYETIGESSDVIVEHLARLMKSHHLPAPDAQTNQIMVTLPNYRMRWERHAEFVTYTVWKTDVDASQLFEVLPQTWLKTAPGRLLSAVEMRIELSQLKAKNEADAQLVKASVAGGFASIQTDYHLKGNGFSLWHLFIHDPNKMSPQRIGRITQQLLEIETYRMMGLLGLPAARAVGTQLKQLEQDLVSISSAIDTAQKSQEPQLLERLTRLASQVESLFAMHHARFSATSAYMSLVDQRLIELKEQAIDEHPTIAVFLSRRLTPAVQTCVWAAKRLQAMSERVSRNSNLLRTRVEIEQQEHHKALLSTMTDRQLSQLRLQATVEGLSAVAMSYYAAGIVGYITKAAIPFGWPLSAEMTIAMSIPIVFFAALVMLKKLKQSALHL